MGGQLEVCLHSSSPPLLLSFSPASVQSRAFSALAVFKLVLYLTLLITISRCILFTQHNFDCILFQEYISCFVSFQFHSFPGCLVCFICIFPQTSCFCGLFLMCKGCSSILKLLRGECSPACMDTTCNKSRCSIIWCLVHLNAVQCNEQLTINQSINQSVSQSFLSINDTLPDALKLKPR